MPNDAAATRPVVSVWGSSMSAPTDDTYRNALELGRLLAQSGADVACGGYGGVMEAACAGARDGGGRAIGYTVRGWTMRTRNEFLSEERPCADLYERLRCLIEDSDALVALGGGIGTLVEVALAWNQFYMGLIPARPLILVGSSWSHAVAELGEFLEIRDAHMEHVTFCDDVSTTLAQLERAGVLR